MRHVEQFTKYPFIIHHLVTIGLVQTVPILDCLEMLQNLVSLLVSSLLRVSG